MKFEICKKIDLRKHASPKIYWMDRIAMRIGYNDIPKK